MKKVFSAIVLFVCVALLVACAPSNSEAAKKKMEKAGYKVSAVTYSEVKDNGAVAQVTGTKAEGDNILSQAGSALSNSWTATLYDSAKNAKAAYNNTKDAEGDTSYHLVGKWVFVGSEDAYKKFK